MFDLALAVGATFTADECAAVAGCLPKSWMSMVSRHYAPPSRGFSPETGERVWDVDEVLSWQRNRPGRGNWASGMARRHPQTRTRLYSFGGQPAWRPALPHAPKPKPVSTEPSWLPAKMKNRVRLRPRLPVVSA